MRRREKRKAAELSSLTASGWDRASAAAPLGAAAPAPGLPPGAGGLLGVTAPGAAASGALVLSAGGAVAAHPAQDTRTARRLFIGNIDAAVSEELLRNFFKLHAIDLRRKLYERRCREAQDAMKDPSTIPEPDAAANPVVEVHLTRGDATRAGFAFVELDTDELATECLALDGTNLPIPGRIVQVRVSRPKNYVPANASINAGTFGGGPPPPGALANRLCMKGYPTHMPVSDVRPLLESIGKLELFDFLRDSEGRSKGQCVFAYEDPSKADECITACNEQEMGPGVKLVVQRMSASTALTVSNLARPDFDPEKRLMQNLLNLGMPLPQGLHALVDCYPATLKKPGMIVSTLPVRPTRVVCLLNMLDADELDDDEEYDELFADVEQEVEKFGRVVELRIPREPPRVPAPVERPPPPRMLLPPQAGAAMICAPGAPPPPPDHALDPNTGQLIPLAALPERAREVDAENKRRRDAWEERCEEIEAGYEAAKERWEHDMTDPVKNGVGKVFVEYFTVDEAHAAQVSLAGRHFGGRTVVASFVPPEWIHAPKEPVQEGAKAETMDEILKSLEAPAEVRAIEAQPGAPQAADTPA